MSNYKKALPNQDVFKFIEHSTGYSDHDRGMHQRLSLVFRNTNTSQDVYKHFGAIIEYTRDTKHHKIGDRRPDGQFSVKSRHEFYKWWLRCGLELPRSPSEFHYKMHLLKEMTFYGEVKQHGDFWRFKNSPISLGRHWEDTGNPLGKCWEDTGNIHWEGNATTTENTWSTDDISPPQFEPPINLNREPYNVTHNPTPMLTPTPLPKPPEQQSNDEWLAAYQARDLSLQEKKALNKNWPDGEFNDYH